MLAAIERPSGGGAAGATGGGGAAVASTSAGSGSGITRTAIPRGGYQVHPRYPASARRQGIQGTTLLRVFVASDGRVTDVGVERTAGHADLDEAAADAVRRWRFDPARRGDEPVGMWVLLPVEFHLK
jgi:protein TonB